MRSDGAAGHTERDQYVGVLMKPGFKILDTKE